MKTFGTKINNAGDRFNDLLVQWFFNQRNQPVENLEPTLIMVGSTLLWRPLYSEKNYTLPKKNWCNVFGTGCFGDIRKDSEFQKNLIIKALRGKLTKNIVENILHKEVNCALGDPGLLAPLIVKPADKRYKFGYIPHYSHSNIDMSSFFKDIDYHIVDPHLPVEVFLKEISKCEVILSESLHGIIFADAYNIPNARVVLDTKLLSGDFKFKDYDSNFDFERLILTPSEIYNSLSIIKSSYTLTKEDISRVQTNLLLVSPLNQNYIL